VASAAGVSATVGAQALNASRRSGAKAATATRLSIEFIAFRLAFEA
jgi:hypothetical protein